MKEGQGRVEVFVAPRDLDRWCRKLGSKDPSKAVVRLQCILPGADKEDDAPGSDGAAEEGGKDEKKALDVLMRPSEEVPRGHIALMEEYEGWSDWARVS